jgi:hypothetical protein
VWLVHVTPRLGRTIPVAELERLHEESKLLIVAVGPGACAAACEVRPAAG